MAGRTWRQVEIKVERPEWRNAIRYRELVVEDDAVDAPLSDAPLSDTPLDETSAVVAPSVDRSPADVAPEQHHDLSADQV